MRVNITHGHASKRRSLAGAFRFAIHYVQAQSKLSENAATAAMSHMEAAYKALGETIPSASIDAEFNAFAGLVAGQARDTQRAQACAFMVISATNAPKCNLKPSDARYLGAYGRMLLFWYGGEDYRTIECVSEIRHDRDAFIENTVSRSLRRLLPMDHKLAAR